MSYPQSPSAPTNEWPAVLALQAAFVAVASENRFFSDTERSWMLRDPVCAAVIELRATGRSSAEIVLLVKLIATQAGFDARRDQKSIEQIGAWCVQRYFAP